MTLPKGDERGRDNSKDYDNKASSNNDMPERDEKKWLIDRIERLLDIMVKDIESERAKHKSDAERVENSYTFWRNAFLAATSFTAPLILGLYSATIREEFMLIILIADLVIGLVAFMVFNYIGARVHLYIQIMDHFYFQVLNALNSVAVHIGSDSAVIDEIETDRLLFFRTYLFFC